jgi:zinc D-Ala-D-Ala carboxypeptidase
MNEHISFWDKYSKLKVVLFVLVIAAIGFGGFRYVKQSKEYFGLKEENTTLKDSNKELEEALKNTTDSLNRVEGEYKALVTALETERQKSSRFADQIDTIAEQVESYQRLAELDPELLQKYSKVYFLSENYVPSALTPIDTKYLFNKSRPMQFHDRAWPFLRNLLDAAAQEGIQLQVASAYRSFNTQAELKSRYRITYGAGTANQFSAEQGYSEHQLGTTLDFTNPKIGGGLEGFDKTDSFTWLKNNAYKYGFVISYPPNNKFYIYEPWHWRFVGLELAKRLHDENKNFYELEQREIDTYLRGIFLLPKDSTQ